MSGRSMELKWILRALLALTTLPLVAVGQLDTTIEKKSTAMGESTCRVQLNRIAKISNLFRKVLM